VWQLKFSRDADPVLACHLGGEQVNVYYQYFSSGIARGNMPDVAVRMKSSGKWLFVLDPKSGETFRDQALAEVCIRYSDAFLPELTCVANYFPGECRKTELKCSRRAIVIQGCRPSTVHTLDQELRAVLNGVGLRTETTTLVILFDISSSTSAAHHRLKAAVQRAMPSAIEMSAASVVVFFTSEMVENLPLSQFLWDRRCKVGGGTDYRAATEKALTVLRASAAGRELWLVGDGDGAFDWEKFTAQCLELSIIVRAFIASPFMHGEIANLARSTGGEYRDV
jgi:hypothetical protein